MQAIQRQGAKSDIPRQPAPGPASGPSTGGGGGAAPPARVVYIDANIIIQINQGSRPVAEALRQMRASGIEVRIAPYQYNELVANPDIPRTATAQRLMLEEMNIRVGAEPTQAQRVDVNLAGQTTAAPKIQDAQIKAGRVPTGGNIMQLKDQQLVASARADGRRNIQIWSLDTPFTSNPGQVQGTYGVQVAPESQLPVVAGQADYRVGRQLLGLEPVQISLTGQVTRGTPPGGGTTPGGGVPPGSPAPPPPPGAGSRFSARTRAVAGGVAAIVAINEILGSINQARSAQQQNIDSGEAQVAFWDQFGARPVRGVWDLWGKHPLPAGTIPKTSLFGSPSFPYVVDIDVAALGRTLPSKINNYQDFVYFLDAGKALNVIQVDPLMPDYPTRAQKAVPRRYYAWVNQPDRANRRRYDITDIIAQVQNAALGELGETTRAQTRSLSLAQQATIYRLKDGPETRVYRSAGGNQPIITAQQIFGPDPWVRATGQREDVGGRFSTDMRALVVPANADAQRAALVSGYWVKQSIEDTLDEVRDGGRPILDRQPAKGPLNSFVAGPEPGGHSRFGQTRYYRHGDPDVRWTIALGELHEFWVKAGDLQPVPRSEIDAYTRPR
jgi:hypothetical protein